MSRSRRQSASLREQLQATRRRLDRIRARLPAQPESTAAPADAATERSLQSAVQTAEHRCTVLEDQISAMEACCQQGLDEIWDDLCFNVRRHAWFGEAMRRSGTKKTE